MASRLTSESSVLPAGELAGESISSTEEQDALDTARLPGVLHMRHFTMLLVLIVLFVSNINGVQFGGPSTFLYWALGLITFLLPSAYVTRWLARRFPGQGAPYLWAAHILGSHWSFFAAFCAWVPGVLSVVSAIEASIVFVQYLVPTWFTTPLEQCMAIICVLAIATLVTCLPLHWLKHVLMALGSIYISVCMFMGIAGMYWLWTGHPSAIAFNVPANWQLSSANFAVYGLVVLALMGVDIPLFMGGEMRGGVASVKHLSNYVWWGAAIAFIAYVLGTFGIMVTVPAAQAGSLWANVLTMKMVFGPVAGNITAVLLALSQVTITIAYTLLFSRLLVIVAQDRRLPASLARINRYGVPALSIIVQSAVTACVTIVAFVVVPSLFGTLVHSIDLAFDIYNVLLAGATAIWAFSTALLFFFVLSLYLRRKYQFMPERKDRIVLITASCVGMLASLLGIWATISSSWIPNSISNQQWAILVWSVILVALAIGWVASELPRMHALLNEQKRVNDREVALRTQLQEAYNEQEILVQQQQELLAEVNRLYREQAQAAVTDAVTGLPNHRAIMSRLDEELARCQRHQSSCAVLFIDLDHFKQVNDTWGHRAGDAILHAIGSRLRIILRAEDFVGRYGGEEFAVVFTNTDMTSVYDAAERLRLAIVSEPCWWEAENTHTPICINVTASIGIAVYQLHGVTREALIEAADRAMYEAKHAGRNCIRIADVQVASTTEAKTVNKVVTERDELVIPEQTVNVLTAVASARDQGTDDHAHRMVELAEATSRMLQRPEEETHLIRLAAVLHDIGKIGIPDAILHKPGPLTDEEWSVMRRHPDIGRHILEQAGGVFKKLAEVVVAHHERWDGRGYPHQLVGEQIPLSARILSVVDSYDAMTARRVYREPFSSEQARAELRRCSGSQYDPQVVEAFLRVLDQLEEAKVVETGNGPEEQRLGQRLTPA